MKKKVTGEGYGGYGFYRREFDTEAGLTPAQKRLLLAAAAPLTTPEYWRDGQLRPHGVPWFTIAAMHIAGYITEEFVKEGKERVALEDDIDILVDRAFDTLRDNRTEWPIALGFLEQADRHQKDLDRKGWFITAKGREAVSQ